MLAPSDGEVNSNLEAGQVNNDFGRPCLDHRHSLSVHLQKFCHRLSRFEIRAKIDEVSVYP